MDSAARRDGSDGGDSGEHAGGAQPRAKRRIDAGALLMRTGRTTTSVPAKTATKPTAGGATGTQRTANGELPAGGQHGNQRAAQATRARGAAAADAQSAASAPRCSDVAALHSPAACRQMVACPVCGARVRVAALNFHMDFDCQREAPSKRHVTAYDVASRSAMREWDGWSDERAPAVATAAATGAVAAGRKTERTGEREVHGETAVDNEETARQTARQTAPQLPRQQHDQCAHSYQHAETSLRAPVDVDPEDLSSPPSMLSPVSPSFSRSCTSSTQDAATPPPERPRAGPCAPADNAAGTRRAPKRNLRSASAVLMAAQRTRHCTFHLYRRGSEGHGPLDWDVFDGRAPPPPPGHGGTASMLTRTVIGHVKLRMCFGGARSGDKRNDESIRLGADMSTTVHFVAGVGVGADADAGNATSSFWRSTGADNSRGGGGNAGFCPYLPPAAVQPPQNCKASPSHTFPCTRRGPYGNAHFSRSVLLSAMQKCVRRGRAMSAVRVALQLVRQCGLGDVARRLMVITIEDGILHPALPAIAWYMGACSKGFVPVLSDIDAVLSYVYEVASATVRDVGGCREKSECGSDGAPSVRVPGRAESTEIDDDGGDEAIGEKEETFCNEREFVDSWWRRPQRQHQSDSAVTSDDIERASAAAAATAGTTSNQNNPRMCDAERFASLGDAERALVTSLLLRALYGGMHVDSELMRRSATVWTRRFTRGRRYGVPPTAAPAGNRRHGARTPASAPAPPSSPSLLSPPPPSQCWFVEPDVAQLQRTADAEGDTGAAWLAYITRVYRMARETLASHRAPHPLSVRHAVGPMVHNDVPLAAIDAHCGLSMDERRDSDAKRNRADAFGGDHGNNLDGDHSADAQWMEIRRAVATYCARRDCAVAADDIRGDEPDDDDDDDDTARRVDPFSPAVQRAYLGMLWHLRSKLNRRRDVSQLVSRPCSSSGENTDGNDNHGDGHDAAVDHGVLCPPALRIAPRFDSAAQESCWRRIAPLIDGKSEAFVRRRFY